MEKAFWFQVGGAVVVVLAIVGGFFIHPLISAGVVLLGSAVAGWIAGRKGTSRDFGKYALALLALLLPFALCMFGDPKAFIEVIGGGDILLAGKNLHVRIPVAQLVGIAATLCVLLSVLVFLGVFNAAILFKRWYGVLIAAAVIFVEDMYLSMWLFYALGGAFSFLVTFWIVPGAALLSMAVFSALLLLLLAAWAVFNVRAVKRRNWRNFVWTAAGFAVGSFLLWGISAGALYIASGTVVESTEPSAGKRGALPPELAKRERELRASLDLGKLHERGIELPLSGIRSWHGRKDKTASAEAKKRTLEFAASDEGKTFFARNLELLDLYCRIAAEGEYAPETSLAHLQGYRSVIRFCGDQAALAHCRGEAAQVLPLLEPAEKLEQALYDHETATIEGLILLAMTDCRLRLVVGCGPESPEYAAQYKAILKRFLAREAKIPADVRFIRDELKHIRCFERGSFTYAKDTGAYARLLSYPMGCATLMCKLREAEENEKLAAEWRKTGVVPDETGNYGLAMRRALATRALYSVALALKAYRCERNEYPDKLDALVPGYLDKLPVDPVTGKALRYKKNPKGKAGFELSASRVGKGFGVKVSSTPRY